MRTRPNKKKCDNSSASQFNSQAIPRECPHCQEKLWSHGNRRRFYENSIINLKRLRCRSCRKVITLKPQGMLERFQSSINTIISAIKSRLLNYRWPLGMPRQRAGHWLRAFLIYLKMTDPTADPLQFLKTLKSTNFTFLGKLNLKRPN